MGRTPPLLATVPLGLVMGAFAGTILTARSRASGK